MSASSHDVERRLRAIPLTQAPDALWDDIRAELAAPPRTARSPALGRPVRPLLAAAAAFVALIAGSYVGVLRAYGVPERWDVVPLTGAPDVAGASLARPGALGAGDWLETDSLSRARLAVGRIGTAEVGPESRLRLVRGGRIEHRLHLERGTLDVEITAPPRLFFVETPAVLATDLGCAYTLDVGGDGDTRIHVTAGWVELARSGRVSLVPAGLVAEVEVGGGPGTPYPADFPPDARAALRRLDEGVGGADDLDLVLAALPGPSSPIVVRRRGAITLWHLLPRTDDALRARVYDRLAGLAPPPDRVTREGILALERHMLTRWRRDLSPMWSEEAQPVLVRAARRLWDWTIR